jgi:hypothetical protein
MPGLCESEAAALQLPLQCDQDSMLCREKDVLRPQEVRGYTEGDGALTELRMRWTGACRYGGTNVRIVGIVFMTGMRLRTGCSLQYCRL